MAGDFKLIQKSYDFYQWLLDHTSTFPKSHRFSVAVRLENVFLDFMQKLVVANRRRNKLPLLHEADESLVFARMLIRLSHDKKFIKTSSYKFAATNLDEIGKMLGGWIRQQKAAS